MVTYGFNDSRLFTVAYGYIAFSIILVFFFVLILLFLSRYMQPEGLWQRHSRCPFQGGARLFNLTISYPRLACTVIVGFSIILFVSVRHVLLFLEHNTGNGVMVNCTLHVWHQTEWEKNLSNFTMHRSTKLKRSFKLTTLNHG